MFKSTKLARQKTSDRKFSINQSAINYEKNDDDDEESQQNFDDSDDAIKNTEDETTESQIHLNEGINLLQKLNLDDLDMFLLKQIQSKAHIHFEEDYYSLTALCFLWTNIKKYKITDQKLSQTFYFLVLIFMVSNFMLLGILWSIVVDKNSELTEFESGSFMLYIVRFVCCIALHIMLFPEVRKGMIIMKYVNNHPEKFRTSYIPFILGLMQYFSSIFAEFLNIYMLTYQSKIEYCIIHFVALEVVVELPKIFFESQHYDNYLYNVFSAELVVENKTS